MELNELQPGLLVRHKGGKLYKILTDRDGQVWMAYDHSIAPNAKSTTRVRATQWQVNEKYPEGRYYQSSKDLKITDLTIA
jgi:hypothetical protein